MYNFNPRPAGEPPPPPAPPVTAQEEIWLLGQPALSDYLDYVREKTIDGAVADQPALIAEWRDAHAYYAELGKREAGIANDIECLELPPEFAPLVEEVKADHRFRLTFDSVPTSFGLVELDRLVLFQKHVTGHFVESLKSRLGPAPDAEALFRFCIPLARPDTSLRMQKMGTDSFLMSSDSLDLRFHEAALLKPEQICGYQSYGAVAGVLGLVVGFSPNFLSAVRKGNRIVLHNGYHRATALRALGITHAPCIIETVTRQDELDLIAKRRVAEDPDFYFESARPPVLKDFFDPKIRKTLPIPRIKRMIELSFEVREWTLTS
jgi:hypothetical protein